MSSEDNVKKLLSEVRDPQFTKQFEQFMSILNSEPDKDKIQFVDIEGMEEPIGYLPIGYVENQLDRLFMGLWSTVNFQYHEPYGCGKISGSLELKVFHPVDKEYVTRIGAASVALIRKTDESRDWAGDLPLLKAECLKNACKTLGNMFGRNINRTIEDDYVPYMNPELASIKTDQQKVYDSFVQVINKHKSSKSLIAANQEIVKNAEKAGLNAKKLNEYIKMRVNVLKEGEK